MTITSRTTHAHRSRLGRLAMLLAASVAACGIAGCNEGGAGQICHLAADAGTGSSCNEGLTCQTPRGCVDSYCCPTPASMSANANCNGTACAPP
jgi:hypothetical protein